MEKLEESQERELAGFAERVVAFGVDLGLFWAAYWLSLKTLFPGYDPGLSPQRPLWSALWTALFLLYQAYASCEGRASVGKKLLGLRVVSLDREPLSLGQAVLRSASYLASSVLGLGFFWVLFTRTRQGWHDMVAGSVVVEESPKSAGARALIRVGALGVLALLGGLLCWDYVLVGHYRDIRSLAFAHVGLRNLSALEKAYHSRYGTYAQTVTSLASVAPDPERFLRNISTVLDPAHGVKIEASKKDYKIKARARDSYGTLVALNGP